MDRPPALALTEAEILFSNMLDNEKRRSVWAHQLVQELRLDDGHFEVYYSRRHICNLLSITDPLN